MPLQNSALHSLASLFEGVDPRRVALAAGVLVLLALVWRKLRDLLVMAVVFGSLFVAKAVDSGPEAPAAAEPTPPPARTVIQA